MRTCIKTFRREGCFRGNFVAPGSALHFGAKQSNPKRTFWLEPDTEKIKKIDRESEEVSFFQGITKKIQGGKWFVGEK